ncbi:MAG: molybdenum cofactor biosynthesis protein B [Gammaproteobacteria bacterium]|jgi:molybdopterin adenylyltransferase|nr:molybdenum cofactor biosynthesis protein B [Gammaproteobacteria bacterium]MBT7603366.1 molybdenum cofactor biosynthesis protein B [Gammaproteobacteria bacterium]
MDKNIKLNIAVLTISDSRTKKTDKSGNLLEDLIKSSGHAVVERNIVKDNIYSIRKIISEWIDKESINAVITTGGTGVTGRDGTPEAIEVLLDKKIEGFGEIFRYISYKKIKTSTIQSRALAGVSNSTYIFCLPGSPGACKDAWLEIIQYQLDSNYKPCNLVELIPRLKD